MTKSLNEKKNIDFISIETFLFSVITHNMETVKVFKNKNITLNIFDQSMFLWTYKFTQNVF